jgi:hypothetical protein
MSSTRFLTSAVAIMSIMAGSTSAGAQRVASNATLGVTRRVVVETGLQDSAKATEKPAYVGNTTTRFVAATMISGAAMVAGAYAGASMEGPCGCDDPGLEGALLGGLGGMLAGASIGAATPPLGSRCSFGERLGRSVVGSLLGGVAGIASINVVHNGAILIVMPALTAGGAVMMLGNCR